MLFAVARVTLTQFQQIHWSNKMKCGTLKQLSQRRLSVYFST